MLSAGRDRRVGGGRRSVALAEEGHPMESMKRTRGIWFNAASATAGVAILLVCCAASNVLDQDPLSERLRIRLKPAILLDGGNSATNILATQTPANNIKSETNQRIKE
jgi:hypothetical protein